MSFPRRRESTLAIKMDTRVRGYDTWVVSYEVNTDLMLKNTELDRQTTRRVITNYESAYPDPLVLRAGEQLATSDRESEWAGWLWCTDHNGNSGWVPETYVERTGDTGLVFCDYDATELTVSAGEELITEQEAGGWLWCTNRRGQSGWVPADNLAPVDQAQN